jgi:hypothetical protein
VGDRYTVASHLSRPRNLPDIRSCVEICPNLVFQIHSGQGKILKKKFVNKFKKALDQQRAEKAAVKEQKVNQSNFSRGSTRRNSKRSMHKTQSSFAFVTSFKQNDHFSLND